MKGLLIKEPWISLILNNIKTWEIRSSSTSIRGEIYLIRSGSGQIVGKASLVDSFPLNYKMYIEQNDKHCIQNIPFEELPYIKPCVWVLNDAQWLPKPVSYKHKVGAVIWVNLEGF